MEFWDAGGNESYLYTEDWQIAKRLRSELGRGAIYIRNGLAFAWQFKMSKQRVKWMRIRFGNEMKF